MSIDLHQAYRSQHEGLAAANEEASKERDDLAAERAEQPELQRQVVEDVFPIFRKWNTNLKGMIKPLKFKNLRRKSKSMRSLLRVVFFDRGAVTTLLSNLLIRLALLIIFLIKLAFATALVYGMFRLVLWLTGRS